MSERTCPVCGVSITRTKPTGPIPTYCSRQCINRAYYRRNRDRLLDDARKRTAEQRAAGKTCPVCGEDFVPERIISQMYCSTRCGRWAVNHLNERTCERPGCNRPHRARGLCGWHYNVEFVEDRHPKAETKCMVCGATVLKYKSSNKKRRPVCSYRCRSVLRYGARPGKDLIGPLPWTDPPRHERSAPLRVVNSTGGVFTSGPCAWCGKSFTAVSFGPTRARYCSTKCGKRFAEGRRSFGFNPSPVMRRRIYERDGWVCQICMEPVDRDAHWLDEWAPSLDHVIPQSWQLLPDHSEANLRLAHRWCNAVRGDETYVPDGLFVK